MMISNNFDVEYVNYTQAVRHRPRPNPYSLTPSTTQSQIQRRDINGI